MKSRLLFIFLCALYGCNTIQQMNSNMQQSNTLMSENLAAMQSSQATIEENTQQVMRSTQTMQDFEKVIASNTETINRVINKVEAHPHLMLYGLGAVLVLLFLPSILLFACYCKLRPGKQK